MVARGRMAAVLPAQTAEESRRPHHRYRPSLSCAQKRYPCRPARPQGPRQRSPVLGNFYRKTSRVALSFFTPA